MYVLPQKYVYRQVWIDVGIVSRASRTEFTLRRALRARSVMERT
jgi:hypothetical protein